MARPEKEAAVSEITEILKGATSVFVTDYKGLTVERITDLRTQCRKDKVSYMVVKNTLARRAAKDAGFDEMVSYLQGPSAIAYSFDDPSAPARIISEFAEKDPANKPEIKMSLFEGVFYGPERVAEIAALPSKNELLAMLVGGFNAPLQGFVGSLHGLLQKLALVVKAYQEQKEQA